jgi:tRNA(fMet)-specific endonuclease VapC
MTLYVLDTDMLTLYQRGHPAVEQHVRQHAPAELAITVITVEEQLSAWYTMLRQARKPEQLARAYAHLAEAVPLLAKLPILTFTEPAIQRYQELKRLSLNIGAMDLRIAAITLEQGRTLVTRNVGDFQRVPHLPIVDWTS